MRKSKDDKNNTITTITPSTSDKTPIEIALQIDKDGMTTLSKLYDFLEIDKSHYSRWCKKNIIENPFANEGYDYFTFRHYGDNPSLGGRPKTDYKLTSDFAKQLCMTVLKKLLMLYQKEQKLLILRLQLSFQKKNKLGGE